MHFIRTIQQFFLSNTSSKQTVIKNTFRLLFAEFINKGSVFFMMILLAKHLGPEQYGQLSYIISFTALFSIIVDYSLSNITIKEAAKHKQHIKSYFFHGVCLKGVLGFINLIVVWCVGYFLIDSTVLFDLLIMYCVYTIINNIGEYLRIRFRPQEKMEHEALLKTISGIVFLVIMGTLVLRGGMIQEIIYGFLFAGILNLVLSALYIYSGSSFQTHELHFQKEIFLTLLKQGFFLAGGVFFINITINFDQFLLGYLGLHYDLGIYSLGYKMTFIYTVIFAMFFQTLLPRIAQEPSKAFFTRGLRRVTSLNLALLLMYGGSAYYLYQQSYRDIGAYTGSLLVFLFLLSYCIFESYGHWGYLHLLALGKEKIILAIFAACAVCNVMLNLFFIPSYSYRGAIGATIITYAIYCFSSYVMAHRSYGRMLDQEHTDQTTTHHR